MRHNYALSCTTLLKTWFWKRAFGVAATHSNRPQPLVAQILPLSALVWHSAADRWRRLLTLAFSRWDWSSTPSPISPISTRTAAPFHHHLWGRESIWRCVCWSVWKGFWVEGLCCFYTHRNTGRLIDPRQRAGSQIKSEAHSSAAFSSPSRGRGDLPTRKRWKWCQWLFFLLHMNFSRSP